MPNPLACSNSIVDGIESSALRSSPWLVVRLSRTRLRCKFFRCMGTGQRVRSICASEVPQWNALGGQDPERRSVIPRRASAPPARLVTSRPGLFWRGSHQTNIPAHGTCRSTQLRVISADCSITGDAGDLFFGSNGDNLNRNQSVPWCYNPISSLLWLRQTFHAEVG
jgi:hypothetical protein